MEQYKNVEEFLNDYNPNNYPKASMTTDEIIFTVDSKETENKRLNDDLSLQVLLIKRKDFPFKDCWAFAGGFLNMDEGITESAYRELEEETGIKDVYIEQLFTWGDDIARDPRDRVISVSYLSLIQKKNIKIEAGDDASEAKWFSIQRESKLDDTDEVNSKILKTLFRLVSDDGVDELNFEVSKKITRNRANQTVKYLEIDRRGLAFDHNNMLAYAIERLESKINYTPIAFNLIDEEFTLYELQKIYELVLNKSLITPNFRKKIKHMVEETCNYETGKQMRPAKLYKYKECWNSWE